METRTGVNKTLESQIPQVNVSLCAWKKIINSDIANHNYSQKKIMGSWGRKCYLCDGYDTSCENYLSINSFKKD